MFLKQGTGSQMLWLNICSCPSPAQPHRQTECWSRGVCFLSQIIKPTNLPSEGFFSLYFKKITINRVFFISSSFSLESFSNWKGIELLPILWEGIRCLSSCCNWGQTSALGRDHISVPHAPSWLLPQPVDLSALVHKHSFLASPAAFNLDPLSK